MAAAELDYVRVTHREPHLDRTRRMLKEHPELKKLFGHTPISGLIVLGCVAAQVCVAIALRHQPWWASLAAAWLFGAFVDHALWVLIHESSHNLILRSSRANTLISIFANLPILFPSAVSFRKYHLLHHRFQGDPTYDADLAAPWESRLVKNVWWRKALWLLLFFVAQGTRVSRLKKVPFLDAWYVLNFVVQIVFVAAMAWLFGPFALLYLFFSSIFAIGLHPVGARWIQEHYLTRGDGGQETFSYYGPLNPVALNVGYHNEHHDLMRVPWMRLPKVKAMAPEYYAQLDSHPSWTALLLKFIFDPKLSLYSRMIRESTVAESPEKVTGLAHVEQISSAA